ncbi:MAG: hypothetical protein H6623_06355 [Bdellovibrionaceae bacterium]|nr:hypothetical protein [Pseudobdellovibrionaceae bacterium]
MRISSGDVAISHHLVDPKSIKSYLKQYPGLDTKNLNIPNTLSEDILDIKPNNFFAYDSSPMEDSSRMHIKHNGIMGVGGDEDYALLAAGSRGFCKEDSLPSGPNIDLRNLNELNQFQAHNKINTNYISDPNLRDVVGKTLEWADSKCTSRIHPPYPFIPQKIAIAKDASDFNKMPPAERQQKQKKLIENIDQTLNNRKPVAVGIDVNNLTNSDWADGTIDHSVLIMGRRKVGNSCQYLIRNSGGRDCSIFLNKLDPTKNCVPEYGAIWVDLQNIPSLYSAISIKSPQNQNRKLSNLRDVTK